MPREAADFEWRLLCDDEDDAYEWRVERLQRRVNHFGVWTDARVVRCKKNGKDRTFPSVNYRTRGDRVDLSIEVPPLGHTSRRAFFHRVVAFAWQSHRCGQEGGDWEPLDFDDWSDFDPALYEVDHGGGVVDDSVRVTHTEVLIDRLAIVTPRRNKELEIERKGLKRRRLK